MSGWTENDLLKFMQVHSDTFGKDILQIKDAEQEWLCKRFTDKLFSTLDWTQVINTPYVDVRYVGKGDIDSIKVKEDFSLSPTQCANIANFITCRIFRKYDCSQINALDSFAVINYIRYGINLRTDYIGLLNKLVQQAVKECAESES